MMRAVLGAWGFALGYTCYVVGAEAIVGDTVWLVPLALGPLFLGMVVLAWREDRRGR